MDVSVNGRPEDGGFTDTGEDWNEKHRPQSIKQIVGNGEAKQEMVQWLRDWPDADPLLLYGPPGLGKTTAAHALAEDFDFEIFEVNASDSRTKDELEENVLETVKTNAMRFGEKRGRIVVGDEADSLKGHGSRVVARACDEATQPFILIGNDYWSGISRSIRDKCKGVEFEYPDKNEVKKRLSHIVKEEGIEITPEAMDHIADNADGDVRAAVNDLQAAYTGLKKRSDKITIDNLRVVDLGEHSPDYWSDGVYGRVYDRSGEKVADVPSDGSLEKVFEKNGPGSATNRAAVIGPEDMGKDETWKALDSALSNDDSHDEWIIPGRRGFAMHAGEYARENDIPYRVTLAENFDDHTEGWSEEDSDLLWSLIEDSCSNMYGVLFEPKRAFEWDLFRDEFYSNLFWNVDTVYAWAEPNSEENEALRQAPDTTDRVNISMLVV